MKTTRSRSALPIPIRRALMKLGADVSAARRRRGISTALMAERAFISRDTLVRVEKGDPGVSLGIYASVLFVLGLGDRIGGLADSAHDVMGRMLEDEQLPKRIRKPAPAGKAKSDGT